MANSLMQYQDALDALLESPNPPVHYALTLADVSDIVHYFDWNGRYLEDPAYGSLGEMIRANPKPFLKDISRYYNDDYYLDGDEEDDFDSSYEGDGEGCWSRVYDMDGDAASALASVGWGTDEDYGGSNGDEGDF